jgi:hypothetical protein
MAQFIQYPLPDNISEAYLQELRERVAARRKAEAMVREILGERDEKPEMSLAQFILTFPKVDCDDSVFERHPERGASNVSD